MQQAFFPAKFYFNVKISNINDSKSCWKIMNSLLSNNSSQTSKITLVDNDKIISDDHEFVKLLWIFVTFFKNAVGSLNIKKIMNSPEVNTTIPHDPVDTCIWKYRDHPSISLIRKNVSFVNPFTFSEVAETHLEKEILKLNSRKVCTFKNIRANKSSKRVLWRL